MMHVPFTTEQIQGKGRGKFLGFPTINMSIPHDLNMEEGIYAAWVKIKERVYMGALHFGPVPAFGEKEKTLEVFLLDTTGEEFGSTSTASLTVTPEVRLRDVRGFDNSDALVAQIGKDVDAVRKMLAR